MFLRETANFGLKLWILRKTARFGVNLHSFVHLFFSLLGTGCAVLFVNNYYPGVSISVGVAIYCLVFSPSSHASSELRVRGGGRREKEKV